ncbi:MAG: hypothetical protein K6T77_01585 [candidate division WOR-3 bacterium]|nr:hypothetical protein [candidate division WOR-3 bacterium]MCR4424215.1 hypothetical protein [candidate division WOR-3 bacterium]MDH7519367.1 hypothetical protein [bacterium]
MVIITHRGGWGNVPLKKSPDILPIVKGIQDYLSSKGVSSVVVPYRRAPVKPPATTPTLPIQLKALTEMLDLHHSQAHRLVAQLDSFAMANPRLKFIFVSVSNGAVFSNQVLELLPQQLAERTYSIELGPPFWHGLLRGENNLILDNDGADPLTTGEVEIVFASLFKGISNILSSWFSGKKPRWEEVWHITDHNYPWEQVRPAILQFLEHRVIAQGTANP